MLNDRQKHALKHVSEPYLKELAELHAEGFTVQFRLGAHDAAMLFSQLQVLVRAREYYPLTAHVADAICGVIEREMKHKPAIALMFELTRNPSYDSVEKHNV